MMKTSVALLAGLLVAADHVVAAPATSATKDGGKFSLPALRNRAYKAHGPSALAKAYHKFGKPLPADLAAAVAKRDTGSVANSPEQYDSEYLCPVQIGTPAQTLTLDFDTGSSDLWVFSSQTPKNDVQGQTLYKPSDSSTAQLMSGESWEISYGDGSSSSGDVYSDVVSVGGLAVQSQAVESAKKVSSTFTSDSASSGLLGLAFSDINTVTPDQQQTFFDNAQSSLDQPVFTADLKHNADGTYNFGYIDDSAYTGSIAYTAVDNSQGFWGFTASGYAVGSGSTKKSSIAGIADTGTTLLLLPDAVVSAYYDKVSAASYDNSQGGYTFDCDADVPDFSFSVGGNTITVPGEFINYSPTGEGNSCFGGIQSDSDIGFSIFGDVALKAAFVVFDGGYTQLGWASKDL